MTLLPVCLFILSSIKSGILYILYYVTCYRVISFVAQIVPTVAIGGSFTLAPVSLYAPLSRVKHFLHYTVFQGLSYIFSAPALELDVSPRSSGVGVPVATEVVLFLIQKKNEVVKGFITFVVQISLDLKCLCLVPRLYWLAPLCLYIHSSVQRLFTKHHRAKLSRKVQTVCPSCLS